MELRKPFVNYKGTILDKIQGTRDQDQRCFRGIRKLRRNVWSSRALGKMIYFFVLLAGPKTSIFWTALLQCMIKEHMEGSCTKTLNGDSTYCGRTFSFINYYKYPRSMALWERSIAPMDTRWNEAIMERAMNKQRKSLYTSMRSSAAPLRYVRTRDDVLGVGGPLERKSSWRRVAWLPLRSSRNSKLMS